MEQDIFKDGHGRARVLRGVTIYSNSIWLAELAGRVGFETVWIEMEHGPAGFEKVETLCLAAEAGGWDGGVVAPGNGLVNLPGDRMGVLLLGSKVPHKHPRRPPLGAIGWATWPKGRLVALKAAVEGSFMTWPILFKGRTVHVNFKTPPAGFIKVEVLGPEGKVLRSFDDCDFLCGNELDRTVTWKGQSDIPPIN